MGRAERQQRFLSDFAEQDGGPRFPSSWQASFWLAQAQDGARKGFRSLQARSDFASAAEKLGSVLASTEPLFDQSTEEGTRFRIYQAGGLELRTTQEPGGEETLGAVFSIRA